MADGQSKSEVRYGADVNAARESYEAEIDQLRKKCTASQMEVSRLLRILSDTRKELAAANDRLEEMLGGGEEEREESFSARADLGVSGRCL